MGPPEQIIGQLLGGKYRIQELLALGGMGLVYGARHEATGRAVAVKLMRPELAGRPELVRRVAAEAQLAVEASHPNVVEVLDAGTHAFDVPYLVLERLYGQPLDALLDEPLPVLTAAQALMPVLNALTMLHRLGIVHRDLKPSNIFLSDGPEGRVTPKLLDFGIAKALESAGTTLSNTALGTPAYMAPEQALGCAWGPFTDVWSIGVVFVRCLTGRLPFEGMASRGIGSLRSGLRVSDLEGVPEPLARVLARALQLDPGERPAGMAEFRADLIGALREADPAQPWPDETTVSYAPHESVLASALAKTVSEPGDSVVEVEPLAKPRVRSRRERTRTLSRSLPARWRARYLRPALLLSLPAAGALAWAALGWPKREVAAPLPAPMQMPGFEAPLAPHVDSSLAGSPRTPAALSSGLEADAPASSPASPERSPAVIVAIPERPQRPAAPPARTTPAKLREAEPPATPEASKPSVLASEAPSRVGANRSPIIEWNAQN